MKKVVSAVLICLLCLSLAAGCAQKKSILGNARWEMTKEELIAAEGEENIVKGSSDQVLNWMQTKDLTVFGDRTVSVGYVFSSEGKLSSITVQIFLKEGETIADGMKATRAEMEKTYGKSEGEDTSCHWDLQDGTISLSIVKGTENFFVANYSSAARTFSD